jgi:hypothetical protein
LVLLLRRGFLCERRPAEADASRVTLPVCARCPTQCPRWPNHDKAALERPQLGPASQFNGKGGLAQRQLHRKWNARFSTGKAKPGPHDQAAASRATTHGKTRRARAPAACRIARSALTTDGRDLPRARR